jgi:hypothetical protein
MNINDVKECIRAYKLHGDYCSIGSSYFHDGPVSLRYNAKKLVWEVKKNERGMYLVNEELETEDAACRFFLKYLLTYPGYFLEFNQDNFDNDDYMEMKEKGRQLIKLLDESLKNGQYNKEQTETSDESLKSRQDKKEQMKINDVKKFMRKHKISKKFCAINNFTDREGIVCLQYNNLKLEKNWEVRIRGYSDYLLDEEFETEDEACRFFLKQLLAEPVHFLEYNVDNYKELMEKGEQLSKLLD